MNYDTILDVIRLGERMRRLQVAYFKTRDRATLIESKEAERAFDRAIAKAIEAVARGELPGAAIQPLRGGLFPGGS